MRYDLKPRCAALALAGALIMLTTAVATAQQARWNGPYLGAHLGGAWGSISDADLDGFIGGAHGGFNVQNGNIVYGVEADISWSGADGGHTDNGTAATCRRVFAANFPCAAGTTTTETVNLDWLASLRARLGFTMGNALIYGTGGIGWANVDVKITDSVLGSFSSSNTHVGWVAGGGVELKFTPNISGRVEALHYGLGSETYNVLGTSSKFDLDVTVVRGGLTYHFN